jgi:hypothetical protein
MSSAVPSGINMGRDAQCQEMFLGSWKRVKKVLTVPGDHTRLTLDATSTVFYRAELDQMGR